MVETLSKEAEYMAVSSGSLETYLLSDHLYWPVDGKYCGQRVLCPGNLLFSKTITQVDNPDLKLQEELDKKWAEVLRVRSKWLSHWQIKANREFDARLREWQDVIREMDNREESSMAHFRSDVRGRVILQLLVEDPESGISGNLEKLKILDDRLINISIPGQFIWDPRWEKIFPESDFRYLYIKFLKGLQK